jgi:hypothetical protein
LLIVAYSWVACLFGDNKSTRYAASFQLFKHQIQL